MKITITIPIEIYEKLERDRGLVPRSTFIQELVKGFGQTSIDQEPETILQSEKEWVGSQFKNDKLNK